MPVFKPSNLSWKLMLKSRIQSVSEIRQHDEKEVVRVDGEEGTQRRR